MSTADIAELYRRWLFELCRGDVASAGGIVADDFVAHVPRLGAQPPAALRGPTAAAAMVEQARAWFADMDLALDLGPVVAGRYVAARWTFRGAYRGGLPGATAPPGTPVALSGIDLLRADGGRFTEYWVSSHTDRLLSQLTSPAP